MSVSAAKTTDTPVTEAAAEKTPADTAPADTAPADTTPADTTPADTTPADTTPVDTTPAETTTAEMAANTDNDDNTTGVSFHSIAAGPDSPRPRLRRWSAGRHDKPLANWDALQKNGDGGLTPRDNPLHRSKLPKDQLTPAEVEARSCANVLRGFFPIAEWLPKYGYDNMFSKGCATLDPKIKNPVRDSLRRDIVAGIVIGIMLVPQGMAYGLLAGLPPIFGLYGSIWPQLAYMIFGTCKFLGPGVNAPISLLMVDSLNFLPDINGTDCNDRMPDGSYTPDCQQFIEYSLLLGVMVSVFYVIMASLQLGVVTAFMPEPALAGFTSGAAVVIIGSQLKHFVGMPNVPRGGVPETIVYILGHLDTIPNASTFLMGLGSLLVLIVLKYVNSLPKVKAKLPMPIPEQLVVLLLAIAVSAGADLNGNYGLPVVGEIPAGLSAPVFPEVTVAKLSELLTPSITVALVTYILTVNVCKAVASEKDLNVDATQEFVALSFESILASVFSGTLPSGSFSRTALLMLLDVESPLHNAVTSLFIVCVCLFLTGTLTQLPMATLAAIIFMALKSMFNPRPACRLWSVSKIEWSQWMIAFLATALLGVTWGILASMIFSVILLLKSAARPRTAVLGVLPDTDMYLPLKMYEKAEEIPGIKIFHFNAPLNFANRDHFQKALRKMEIQNVNVSEDIHTVIVDCSAVTSVDSSALKLVTRVAQKYQERGILLLFGNWHGIDATGRRVMNFLKFNAVNNERMFFWLTDAIKYAKEQKVLRDAEKAAAEQPADQEVATAGEEKKQDDLEGGGIEMQAQKVSV